MLSKEAKHIKLLPISTLAYLGDAYYELLIRQQLLACHQTLSGKLHHLAVKYVSATAQANLVQNLLEQNYLHEEEVALIKRARNSNPHSCAKNADKITYRYATAFEALIGYLYLSGQLERIDQLLHRILPDLFCSNSAER